MSRIEVRLETEFDTGDGNHLAAVGDVVELGMWDPAHAAPCTNRGNVQRVHICVPSDTVFEFKWILLDGDNHVLRWQEGDNRRVVLPSDTDQVWVLAPWDDTASVDGHQDYQFRARISSALKFIANHERKWQLVALAAVGMAVLATTALTFGHMPGTT